VLRARLATAAVAIPLLLVLIFRAPSWLFALVICAIGILGVIEYVGLAFPDAPGPRALGAVLGALLTILAGAAQPGVALVGALAGVVSIGLIAALMRPVEFERSLADLGITLVGILYVGLLLPHFVWLRAVEQGPAWIVFVLAVGMAGDSAGYFVGHAVGRHKLAPRLSPGKTVEGAVGIMLGSVLGAVVVRLLFLRAIGWSEVTLLALAAGVLGQLGDLSESLMKRAFGAKESGWIFPGHGGVLDRIDSLLFPVCFVYYYLLIAR
jgi:phosphatidate cytidylyltransferase